MGLHVMVLKLAGTSAHGCVTPTVTALIWPFVLKLSLALRSPHQTYSDLLRSSRLFFFQLVQIFLNHEHLVPNGTGYNRTRWDRALRLVSERIAQARRWHESELDEDSLRNLSMLAL